METRYWIARLRKLLDDLNNLAEIESSRAQDANGAVVTALHDGKSLGHQQASRMVLELLRELVNRAAS